MNERRFILHLALKECTKKRDQVQKRVDKLSDQLFHLNDHNSTVRRRANMRVSLSTACEERDRWQNRVNEIEKWMGELK